MGKLLIILGVILIIAGLLFIYKVPIPLGKLPGDIVITTPKGKNIQFYFPIVTCIILSILFSFLYFIFFDR